MSKLIQAVIVFLMGFELFVFCTFNITMEVGVINLYSEEIADNTGIRHTVEMKTVKIPVSSLSEDDILLIALVTMAEAEGESEEGKRLVIDTILNRVDSPYFPDTVYGVVYQKNQFSSMWNGRVNRCEVKNDICELVIEESISRRNAAVIYFTAGHYGEYGTPMFSIGNHYFASYE